MTLYPTIYGFLIAIAIYVCIYLIEKRINNPQTWNVALAAIVSGIIGARLYHVLDLWSYYSQNTFKVFYVWQGGLGIWGAVIGGLLGTTVYLSLKKLPKTYWLDQIAAVLPIGQAIGRLGNYFNHENFGLPTNLPWKMAVPEQYIPLNYLENRYFHPLFAYEAILLVALFLFLQKTAAKHPAGQGVELNFYLAGYGSIRFLIEFIKINPWTILGLNVAQLISGLAIVIATINLLKLYRKI